MEMGYNFQIFTVPQNDCGQTLKITFYTEL